MKMMEDEQKILERGRQSGLNEGIFIGRQSGLNEGQDQMAKLTEILIDANRLDDLKKATKDVEFRKSLLLELGIDNQE